MEEAYSMDYVPLVSSNPSIPLLASLARGRRAPGQGLLTQRIRRLLLSIARRVVITNIIVIVVVLVCLLLTRAVSYTKNNYEGAKIDWKADLSHLQPMNQSFADYNVVLDGHVHTTTSDSRLSPSYIVDLAYANGYSAVVVTDHNTVKGSLEARSYAEKKYPNKLIVIPGQEYTCCRIHMNIIGVEETIQPSSPFPSDYELKQVVDRVHSLGGLVVVNHIFWSNHTTDPHNEPTLPHHPTHSALLGMGIDGIEVVNGATFDLSSYQFYLRNRQLFAITGSDLHDMDGAYSWTVLKAQNLSASAIMSELRRKRTSFMFDAAGTRMRAIPDITYSWAVWAPIDYIASFPKIFYQLHKGMYDFMGGFCHQPILVIHWQMIFCWFVWTVVFAVCYELLAQLVTNRLR